jgi:hypothetical protein
MDTAGNHAWNCQLRKPLQIDPPDEAIIEWGKKAIVESLERRIKELNAEVERLESALEKLEGDYDTALQWNIELEEQLASAWRLALEPYTNHKPYCACYTQMKNVVLTDCTCGFGQALKG